MEAEEPQPIARPVHGPLQAGQCPEEEPSVVCSPHSLDTRPAHLAHGHLLGTPVAIAPPVSLQCALDLLQDPLIIEQSMLHHRAWPLLLSITLAP